MVEGSIKIKKEILYMYNLLDGKIIEIFKQQFAMFIINLGLKMKRINYIQIKNMW